MKLNHNKKSVKISLNLFALYAVLVCGIVFALPAPRKGRNRKKRQHIAMGEVSGDDVHIFLPIVGGLFRQLRLSHKGKAQSIGVGAHAANGIGQDGGRNVQQTVIIIIWF